MSKPPQKRKKPTSAPPSDDTPTASSAEDTFDPENPASATITVTAAEVPELTEEEQSDKPDGMAWSEEFSHISLDNEAVIDFFSNLPDVQKKLILDGMTANREVSQWKYYLENTHSYWHIIYMEMMYQFATPEIYLNDLRATISQE